MARKIYKRIGIRRQNNLSDLSNTTDALNNVLEGLATQSDETFIKEDLNCIKNIFSDGLTSNQFQLLGDSAQKYTDTQGNELLYKPLVTFQNKLDVAEVASGNPRLHGGDGLSASYYNEDQIQLYDGAYGGNLTGEPFATDKFWEEGNFAWDRKIHPSSANINGGVQWEGYFTPTRTGNHTFYIDTSGSQTFDFEEQSWTGSPSNPGVAGTYKRYNFIGISSSLPIQAVSSGNVITLQNLSDVKYIGIGQSVGLTVANINSNETDTLTVKEYSASSGSITLNPPSSGDAVTGSISAGTNIDFSKGVDQSVRSKAIISYQLEAHTPYRIRLQYFIPQEYNAIPSARSYDMDLQQPGSGVGNDVRYTFFYNLDYNFDDDTKGTFNKYYDNSILFGGGTVGGTSKPNYVEIKSSKKVDVRYNPLDITLTDSTNNRRKIEFASHSLTATSGSSVLGLSDTTGIEVGNYVYDETNIANDSNKLFVDGTRVKEVLINKALILTNKAQKSGTATLKFIDHRGHVKRISGTIPNGNGTISMSSNYNKTGITKGMVIVSASGLQRNTKVKDVDSGTAQNLNVTPDANGNTSGAHYIYYSQGLTNESLKQFCTPASDQFQNKCVTVTGASDLPAGTTTIPVDNVANIDIDDRVLGYYFKDGTQIQSISSSPASITIKNPGTNGTDKLIKPGNNFTVSTLNLASSDDKGLCCPPKDTSPPFEATDDGMKTVNDFKILEIAQGNIIFDAFSATVDSSNTETASTTSDFETLLNTDTTKRIKLQTPSGLFKLITS